MEHINMNQQPQPLYSYEQPYPPHNHDLQPHHRHSPHATPHDQQQQQHHHHQQQQHHHHQQQQQQQQQQQLLQKQPQKQLQLQQSQQQSQQQKRDLLFYVNCSLEIPTNDFDDNWWPLVSNI